jgi:heme-degrading monooxygenase HmoA
MAMAMIEKGRKVMTLVNIFSVTPDKQTELASLLIRATEETMRHLPGFVSATIHRSLDGKKVVNYAQWRSEADFKAMLGDSRAQTHMKAASAVASPEPIACEVVESIVVPIEDRT